MKAQAAIEYLMTYGWAIMVIAVVLVILMATGVLQPTSNIKESCIFPPQVNCLVQYASINNGKLAYRLRIGNNFGYDVIIKSAKATFNGKTVTINPNKALNQSGNLTLTFIFNNININPGKRIQLGLELEYQPCPIELKGCSSHSYVIKGSSFVKVNKK